MYVLFLECTVRAHRIDMTLPLPHCAVAVALPWYCCKWSWPAWTEVHVKYGSRIFCRQNSIQKSAKKGKLPSPISQPAQFLIITANPKPLFWNIKNLVNSHHQCHKSTRCWQWCYSHSSSAVIHAIGFVPASYLEAHADAACNTMNDSWRFIFLCKQKRHAATRQQLGAIPVCDSTVKQPRQFLFGHQQTEDTCIS